MTFTSGTQTVASSVYSVPASQAIDRLSATGLPDRVPNYRRNKSHSCVLEQRQTMRIITRKGKVLCADGVFRDPNIEENGAMRKRSWDPFKSTYEHRPPRSLAQNEPTLATRKQHVEDLHARYNDYVDRSDRAERFVAGGTDRGHGYARAETRRPQSKFHASGHQQPLPLRNITAQAVFEEPFAVSKSRYITTDAKAGQPTRRPSLVRRLSDSVKGVFRRRPSVNKRGISRPRNLHDYDPRQKDGRRMHPEINAVPLSETQTRGHSVRRESRTVNRYHGLDKSARSAGNMDRALPLRDSAQERRIRVVGDPKRVTQMTDFMHANSSSDVSKVKADDESIYTKEGSIDIIYQDALPPLSSKNQYSHPSLAPKALEVEECMSPLALPSPVLNPYKKPPRKPSILKRVDTSKKSWMPPDRGRYGVNASRDMAPGMTSAPSGEMAEEKPTVDELFDPVEEIIDAYNISEDEWAAFIYGKGRLNMSTIPAGRGVRSVGGQAVESEIVIDTWVHGSDVSWVATERPNPRGDDRAEPGNEMSYF